jgi:hypothetical protein
MTTSGLNANTRYAALVTIDHDLECLASLPQSDIGKLQQPAPHAPLQHRAAYRQPDEFARRVAQIAALIEPKDSVEDIA